MDTIKAGPAVIDFIEACYRADRPPLLIGPPGIGKSELLEQAASKLGIDYIWRDLSLMEPPDLVGLPKFSGGKTRYSPPEFLPTGGRGIIAFEELNRCERYMSTSCLQLLTARRLNDYELPKGWLPAAAINPPDGDFDVFSLDPALLSRFVQVAMVPDQQEWLEWARRSDIHPDVIRYVSSDESIFEHPESNPRAWKYVSDHLHTAEKHDLPVATLRTAVFGLVGNKRGLAFLHSRTQLERPLTAESILSDYLKHQGTLTGWVSEGKLDLVKASLSAVKKHLQPRADFKSVSADRTRFNHLGRFLDDLPGDLRQEAREFFDEHKYPFPRKKKGAVNA